MAPTESPDDLLARVAHVISAGLSNRDVEWQSGIARGFLREARQGGRRGPRNADSWGKISLFLEAWEPKVEPRRMPRTKGRASKRSVASSKRKQSPPPPVVTIMRAFADFVLEEQANGASVRVLEQHCRVFGLFEGHLDRYAEDDRPGEEGPFVARHGPERLLSEYSMFFSYYLPRKVICSKATIRATGVTGAKFARWLGGKGLVDADAATEAAEAARYKSRELLEEIANEGAPNDHGWAWA